MNKRDYWNWYTQRASEFSDNFNIGKFQIGEETFTVTGNTYLRDYILEKTRQNKERRKKHDRDFYE